MSSSYDLARDIIDPAPTAGSDYTCHVSPKGNAHNGPSKDCHWCRALTDGDRGVFLAPTSRPAAEPVYVIMASFDEDGSVYIEYSDGTTIDFPDRASYDLAREYLKKQASPSADDPALDRCGMTGGMTGGIRPRITDQQRAAYDTANRTASPWAPPATTNRQARNSARLLWWMYALSGFVVGVIILFSVVGVLSLIGRMFHR